MRTLLAIAFLLATAAVASARFHGGVSVSAPPPPLTCGTGILCPLAGGSLVTTNSGTLTFPGSSGWYGFDVFSNGSPLNMEAIGICTAANGVCAANTGGLAPRTFFKFKSVLETPTWLATYCLADSLAISQTSDAPSGASVTDRNVVVFTWNGGSAPNYNIARNGVNFATGDRMILADDGMMYFSQSDNGTAHRFWWGYSPYPTSTTGTQVFAGVASPTTIAAGTLRAVAACPSGL